MEKESVSLRKSFSRMAPMGHDAEDEKSEVLAYIAGELGCGLGEAKRAFNSMRNHRSGVLVFDHMERKWHGCLWVMSDADAERDRMRREMLSIRRELAEIKREVRKLRKRSGRGGRRTEEHEDEEQPQQPQAQPEPPKVDKPFEEKTVGELTDEEFRAVLRQGIRMQVVEDEDPDEP
jgi:hypothetical protein